MAYSVSCKCGECHSVSATQAGVTIACRCGNSVVVPRLSDLRRSAGETPIRNGVVERIQSMIWSGEIPGDGVCPYSHRPADAVAVFVVQCEWKWKTGGERDVSFLVHCLTLFSSTLAWLIARANSRPEQEFGRDTVLELPLRISADVGDEITALRDQKKLRMLLCSVPIYTELFATYPAATIKPLRVH